MEDGDAGEDVTVVATAAAAGDDAKVVVTWWGACSAFKLSSLGLVLLGDGVDGVEAVG